MEPIDFGGNLLDHVTYRVRVTVDVAHYSWQECYGEGEV